MSLSSLKKLSDLPWQSHFVARLPGDPEVDNYTRAVREVSYSLVKPTPAAGEAKLLGWSQSLAADLGILKPSPDDPQDLAILAGNLVLPSMRPYAARYGGHQFGHWAGQLGDGRAITLGEVATPGLGLFEYQLKGAGPTPYSRRADGRAVLRSSLREFLCSEAMHFLGVPTTRALSLVLTGEQVVRDLFYDGNPKAEPGAIVCRVAPSFLRFGNFEILASHNELDLLKKLTDTLIEDHYPEIDLKETDPYGKLLDEIAVRTAHMITHWMRVGFVHGVMNTDNMSALGLTIDYGPYGWLEPYDPNWTPNITDSEGRRYRFGNQPSIALWNLARLGEALLPLLETKARVQQSLDLYRTTFEKTYEQMLAAKLGFSGLVSSAQQGLMRDLFQLLQASETDFTIFFRALSHWQAEEDSHPSGADAAFLQLITPAFYAPEDQSLDLRQQWALWSRQYSKCLRSDWVDDATRSKAMKKVNPKFVLRNYLAQNATNAAEKGDLSLLNQLMEVLTTPYDEHPAHDALALKRPEWARHAPGCSMLSCSS